MNNLFLSKNHTACIICTHKKRFSRKIEHAKQLEHRLNRLLTKYPKSEVYEVKNVSISDTDRFANDGETATSMCGSCSFIDKNQLRKINQAVAIAALTLKNVSSKNNDILTLRTAYSYLRGTHPRLAADYDCCIRNTKKNIENK